MGETSKKRGEFGENIVEKLLQLVGWRELLKGRDFECSNPVQHATSTRGRSTHGGDVIYSYTCQLVSNRQQFVIISSKYSDGYPSNPASTFKAHLRDLAYALECFKKSSLRSQLKDGQYGRDYKDAGVLFWLDNGKEGSYDDVIERLMDISVDNDLEFESIYLVDNKRAHFLYDTITFSDNFFEDKEIEFLIPNTGYNNTVEARMTSSPILPVQYINSSILPFKIIQAGENGKATEILVLNVIDRFEKEYLRRLISLSQKLTEGWGDLVYVLFPEFNENVHGEVVENVKLEFSDKRFIKKVEIGTFNGDFRNV